MAEPTTTVRLPAKLRARLGRHAKSAGKSQSTIIIEALNEYLEHRNRAQHQKEINREMQRLATLERQSSDLREFYDEIDEDPWGAQ